MIKRFCLFQSLSYSCTVCVYIYCICMCVGEGSQNTLKNTFFFLIQIKKESIFTWRVELAKTEKYWEGWFRGLSALFLTCPVPKLLLLAGEICQITRVIGELTLLLIFHAVHKRYLCIHAQQGSADLCNFCAVSLV